MLSAVEEHAEAHLLPFPVLKDTIYDLADQLQAVVTPEAFLIQPVRPAAADDGGETKYHPALQRRAGRRERRGESEETAFKRGDRRAAVGRRREPEARTAGGAGP